MRVPAWVSWSGLLEHGGVGLVVTGLSAGAGAAPWLAIVLTLGLGLWHEWSDGDFTTEAGAPWNGVFDALMFVLPALGWWALR